MSNVRSHFTELRSAVSTDRVKPRVKDESSDAQLEFHHVMQTGETRRSGYGKLSQSLECGTWSCQETGR